MEKAILIPANPARVFLGGQDEGSIDAHSFKIKEAGAVYWRLVAPGEWVAAEFPHSEITKGFLYDVSVRRVTHSCDISWIRPMSELALDESQEYFLEKFKSAEHFDEVSEVFYVLKMTAINELKESRLLSSFIKYTDNQPVKLVRNYCIVNAPD
jgi:hypothetical protein